MKDAAHRRLRRRVHSPISRCVTPAAGNPDVWTASESIAMAEERRQSWVSRVAPCASGRWRVRLQSAVVRFLRSEAAAWSPRDDEEDPSVCWTMRWIIESRTRIYSVILMDSMIRWATGIHFDSLFRVVLNEIRSNRPSSTVIANRFRISVSTATDLNSRTAKELSMVAAPSTRTLSISPRSQRVEAKAKDDQLLNCTTSSLRSKAYTPGGLEELCFRNCGGSP